jgi:hypothetical protein
MSNEQTTTEEVNSFYRGARILLPAIAVLITNIVSLVWYAGQQRKDLELLQQKLETETNARISLQVEVKLNSERLGDQAVILGRFEEKLNNVEKTGNETLELLRDYTGRH